MVNELKFVELKSAQAMSYAEAIAALRIKVFAEWPYLYEGDLDYELKYLDIYFKSEHSFVVLAMDGDKVVGASTAIWLPDAEEAFQKPFVELGIDPKTVCYFGESVLLGEYRGRGAGKKFMQAREMFARSLPNVKIVAFCAVVRDENHPRKPKDYRPLGEFWQTMGFTQRAGMIARFPWKDLGDLNETEKELQFWLKDL